MQESIIEKTTTKELKFQESTLEEMEPNNTSSQEEESYIDKISKLTRTAREKKDVSKKDLLDQYINEAVNYIANNVEEKMINDAKKGHTYTILHTFSDNYDKTENSKSKFGPYLLKKFIFMKEFEKALTERVNKKNDSSEKFYTYSRFYHTPEGVKMWNICVSWKNIINKGVQAHSKNRNFQNRKMN